MMAADAIAFTPATKATVAMLDDRGPVRARRELHRDWACYQSQNSN
jgi:hypothetical protein